MASAAKATVVLTFRQTGIQPPVYVAGSFSAPPWSPEEMDYKKDEDGEHLFTKEVVADPGSSIQYKFRIGHGDWWVLNEESPSITDASGNRNNELLVPELPDSSIPSAPIDEDEEQRPDPSSQPEDVQVPDVNIDDTGLCISEADEEDVGRIPDTHPMQKAPQNTKLHILQCPDDSDADEAIGLGEGETTEHVGSEDLDTQAVDHDTVDKRAVDQGTGNVTVPEMARVIAPPMAAEAADVGSETGTRVDAAEGTEAEALVEAKAPLEAEASLEALIATDEATSTGVDADPTNQVTSRRSAASAAATTGESHAPVPARSISSGLQARTKDDDNWLVAFLRKIVVEWIGGIINRLCGGKRKTLLTATTAMVLTGLALWKMTGKDRRY